MHVEFDLQVWPDDTPVRGNAMASVRVGASIGGIKCSDYLGCCSYTDEADFRGDAYYLDMKGIALSDLRKEIEGYLDAVRCAEYDLAAEREAYYERVKPTDVVFLRDGDDLFAVFPGIAGDMDYARGVQCYAHVGQHHCADIAYCNECDEVTDKTEYADLAAELSCIGYDLYVVSKYRMLDYDYTDARREQVQII